MQTRQLTTEAELKHAYPLMHELRTHLSLDEYLDLLRTMQPEGYELWALEDEGEMKALAGIGFGTNFYYGRYVWVFDLITRSTDRSKGYGAALLRHVEKLAEQRRCDVVALSSGLERADAHRFYESRMGYERAGYVFKKG